MRGNLVEICIEADTKVRLLLLNFSKELGGSHAAKIGKLLGFSYWRLAKFKSALRQAYYHTIKKAICIKQIASVNIFLLKAFLSQINHFNPGIFLRIKGEECICNG